MFGNHALVAGEPESAQQNPGKASGEESLKKRIPKHIAWWIAALSGIAGIVGTYIAIQQARPQRVTIESWAAEANAICDRDAGDRHDKLRAAQDSYSAALNAWRVNNYWVSQQFYQAGTLYLSAAGSYLEVRGDLAKIKQPTGRESDIREILTSLDKLQAHVSGLGYNLRSASGSGDYVTANKYLALAQEEFGRAYAAGQEVNGLLRERGADRCAGTWQ